jgi:hypothetical protein
VFGSTILEVAIGLIFIYMVLGLICTSVNEYIAQMLSLRADNLYEAVHGLFTGPDAHRLAEDIYEHDAVKTVSQNTNITEHPTDKNKIVQHYKKPSYLTPEVFSTAIIDLLGLTENPNQPFVSQLKTNPYYRKDTLVVFKPVFEPAKDLHEVKERLEGWFTIVMERALGWYKRRLQTISFLVALGVVCIANADTVMIFDRLWANPAERVQLEAVARAQTLYTEAPGTMAQVSKLGQGAVQGILGWAPSSNPHDPRRVPNGWNAILIKIIGLLITAFAAALGAPFWFDMLNKVMNIRSAGASPNEAPKVPARGDKKK